MAGSARWAVVGLACLLVVLGLTPSVVGMIMLKVNYPEDDNYSYVTLTCRNAIDPLSSDQTPATFWRGTSQIFTSGSQLVVEVTDSTDDSISFVFNQDQEGSFTCMTAFEDDEVSNVEKLAGRVVIQYWQYYILVVCVCDCEFTACTLFSQPCHQPPTIHQ